VLVRGLVPGAISARRVNHPAFIPRRPAVDERLWPSAAVRSGVAKCWVSPRA
jgi:hypothetical protein